MKDDLALILGRRANEIGAKYSTVLGENNINLKIVPSSYSGIDIVQNEAAIERRWDAQYLYGSSLKTMAESMLEAIEYIQSRGSLSEDEKNIAKSCFIAASVEVQENVDDIAIEFIKDIQKDNALTKDKVEEIYKLYTKNMFSLFAKFLKNPEISGEELFGQQVAHSRKEFNDYFFHNLDIRENLLAFINVESCIHFLEHKKFMAADDLEDSKSLKFIDKVINYIAENYNDYLDSENDRDLKNFETIKKNALKYLILTDGRFADSYAFNYLSLSGEFNKVLSSYLLKEFDSEMISLENNVVSFKIPQEILNHKVQTNNAKKIYNEIFELINKIDDAPFHYIHRKDNIIRIYNENYIESMEFKFMMTKDLPPKKINEYFVSLLDKVDELVLNHLEKENNKKKTYTNINDSLKYIDEKEDLARFMRYLTLKDNISIEKKEKKTRNKI